jgi:Transmembrane secretion effector
VRCSARNYRLERIRRRDGASRWGIDRDTEHPDLYVEAFIVSSWAEHLRQHERFTRADHALEERIASYTLKEAIGKAFYLRCTGKLTQANG